MRDFYENLVTEYGEELYRFAYRFCGDRHIAEDLLSEAYTEAWRSLPKLRKRESARAWLYKILRYRCLNWLRSKRRHPEPKQHLDGYEDTYASNEEGSLEKMEREEELTKALNSLDERYREAFLIVFMEGMTCKEAAEELDVPTGTILSRIHRAREHLRERLADYWESSGNHVDRGKITQLRKRG